MSKLRLRTISCAGSVIVACLLMSIQLPLPAMAKTFPLHITFKRDSKGILVTTPGDKLRIEVCNESALRKSPRSRPRTPPLRRVRPVDHRKL